MFERYTEKARRVIFFARYEASKFGASAIKPEHLLLGLLREDKSLGHFFPHTHVPIESVREEIEGRTPNREEISSDVELPLAPEIKRVLAYAHEESDRLQDQHIGTEHLLLGLLREDRSMAAEILYERGLRLNAVRNEIARITSVGFEDQETTIQIRARDFISIGSINREVRLLRELLVQLSSLYERADWASSDDNAFIMRIGLRQMAYVFSKVNSERLPPSIREEFEILNKYLQHLTLEASATDNTSQSRNRGVWQTPFRDLQRKVDDWLRMEVALKGKAPGKKRKLSVALKYNLLAAVCLFFIATGFLAWRITQDIMSSVNGISRPIYLYGSYLVISSVVLFFRNDLRQAIREL